MTPPHPPAQFGLVLSIIGCLSRFWKWTVTGILTNLGPPQVNESACRRAGWGRHDQTGLGTKPDICGMIPGDQGQSVSLSGSQKQLDAEDVCASQESTV